MDTKPEMGSWFEIEALTGWHPYKSLLKDLDKEVDKLLAELKGLNEANKPTE